MVRTIVQLTENQAEELRRRAREQGVSISQLVRQGVDKLLSTPSADEAIRRRALAAVGFIRDEPDLSVDHDQYLAEIYDK